MSWFFAVLFLVLWLATSILWRDDAKEWGACFKTTTFELHTLWSERKTLTAKVKELEAEVSASKTFMDASEVACEALQEELSEARAQLDNARTSLEANVALHPRKRKPWADAIKEAFDA